MSTETQGILQRVYDPAAQALRITSAGDYFALGPEDFQFTTNPQFVTSNNMTRIAFDAATTESVRATFTVPSAWASFVVDLYWVNEGAGAGNVRWNTNIKVLTSGNLITEAVTSAVANVTAPAQNTVQLRTAHQTVTTEADAVYALQVDRVGGDGGDTLANDAGLIAVRIRQGTS